MLAAAGAVEICCGAVCKLQRGKCTLVGRAVAEGPLVPARETRQLPSEKWAFSSLRRQSFQAGLRFWRAAARY